MAEELDDEQAATMQFGAAIVAYILFSRGETDAGYAVTKIACMDPDTFAEIARHVTPKVRERLHRAEVPN